jgi:ferredoxin-NADP reductase
MPVGTRPFAERPFGVFTDESRTDDKALLIAGGIGITPVRALLEQVDGDVVALYRVVSADDIVFMDELDQIAAERGARVEYVVGDHATPEGRDLLSPTHLKELVLDIAERDVYLCGPVGLIDRIVPNLRRADIPRRHLHVERFVL